MKRRLLSGLLVLTMVLSMVPFGALAEGTEEVEPTAVTEVTEATGATEAVETTNAAEETEATETTAATEVTEGADATEAAEGTEATEATEETETTEATEATEGSEPAVPSEVERVQALIDALPTLDTVTAEDYDAVQDAYDAYEALTEEEQSAITGAEVFEELFGWFNEQIAMLETKSGDCGNNLTWTLDDNGTLTISGSGPMDTNPWSTYKNQIKTIVIEQGVETICPNAFSGCGNLTSATIAGSVDYILAGAFNRCTQLQDLTIQNGVERIDENAFYCCESLVGITIPGSVTSIGTAAFNGCDNLTNLTISEGVQTISANAFYNCYALTNVTIPSSVTTISGGAFGNCTALSSVTYLGTSGINVDENVFRLSPVTTVNVPYSYTGTEFGGKPVNKRVYTAEELNAAVNDGVSLIVLESNITLTSALTISGKTLTLDLNGHVLQCSDADTVLVQDGSELTVKDSGTGGKMAYFVCVSDAKFTLDSGEVYGVRANATVYLNGGTVSMLDMKNKGLVYCGGATSIGSKMNTDEGRYGIVTCKVNDTVYCYTVSQEPAAPTHPEGKQFLGWFTEDGKLWNFSTMPTNYMTVIAKFADPDNVETEAELEACIEAGYTPIKLGEDITLTDNLEISGKTLTLDLNGHKLSRSTGATIVVTKGANLTVTDSVGGGEIVNTASNGVCVSVSASQFTLAGGKLNGGWEGVAVSGDAAKFTMTGGEISAKYAGVLMGLSTEFTMNGGRISGAGEYGIGVIASGTFKLNAGSVSGNLYSVKGNDGNSYLNGGTLTGTIFCGNSMVYFGQCDTTNCSVKTGGLFKALVRFHVDGELYACTAGRGDYSVTKPTAPADSDGKVFMGWFTSEGKQWNFSDDVTEDMTLTAKFDTPESVTTAETLETFINAGFTNIKLGDDIPLDGTLIIPEGKNITLDMNGHKLTSTMGGSYAVVVNGTLTLTGEGTIEHTGDFGIAVGVNEGTLILNSGTIQVTDGDSICVQLADCAVFTMNGGMLSGAVGVSSYDGCTMNANGGSVNGSVYNAGTITTTSGTATVFTGTEAENENGIVSGGDFSNVNTLKGIYKITFQDGNNTIATQYRANAPASEVTYEKTGFVLLGWYNGETQWDFTRNVTEDVTLTAKFQSNEVTTEEELKAAIENGATDIQLKSDLTLSYDLSVTQQDWNLDLNGHTLSGAQIKFSTGKMTVTDSVGGGSVNNTITLTSATLTGTVFNGYVNCLMSTIDGGTFNGQVNLLLGSDVKNGMFYAQSSFGTATTTGKQVVFQLNGSFLHMQVTTGTVTAPEVTKTGYTFTGWCQDAECKGDKWDFTKTVSENMTLYGKSEIITYTITYAPGAEDATGTIASGTKTYGQDFTLNVATYTRKGYIQVGWEDEDGNRYQGGDTYKENADLNLTAVWEEVNSFTVPFTKTVKQSGSTKPGKATFSLYICGIEKLPSASGNIDCTGRVDIKGTGDFAGELTISGSRELVWAMLENGIYIREWDSEMDNWTYDDSVYFLRLNQYDDGYRLDVYDATAKTVDQTVVFSHGSKTVKMTFTNTYGTTTTTADSSNPKTGDSIWLAVGTLILSTMALVAILPRKKRM